jgi:trans-aconitate methyltransferase
MSGNGWPRWEHYETFVGGLSRRIAVEFLDWLAVASQRRWLDVGCGPGAVTETILK